MSLERTEHPAKNLKKNNLRDKDFFEGTVSKVLDHEPISKKLTIILCFTFVFTFSLLYVIFIISHKIKLQLKSPQVKDLEKKTCLSKVESTILHC